MVKVQFKATPFNGTLSGVYCSFNEADAMMAGHVIPGHHAVFLTVLVNGDAVISTQVYGAQCGGGRPLVGHMRTLEKCSGNAGNRALASLILAATGNAV